MKVWVVECGVAEDGARTEGVYATYEAAAGAALSEMTGHVTCSECNGEGDGRRTGETYCDCCDGSGSVEAPWVPQPSASPPICWTSGCYYVCVTEFEVRT